MTTLKRDEKTPARQALQTFLAFVLLFLLYAIAVQVTEIDLEKMRAENRQTQLVNVLRFLADPAITEPNLIDPLFVDDTEPFSLTETTVNTLNLIVETIFMALLATTIGTVLAVPVSFGGAEFDAGGDVAVGQLYAGAGTAARWRWLSLARRA